ncbi:unnamed protein product [Candida verbasci]|uniref:Chromatin modification-related protein EAF3 n=1 Tax=Candida verbasci TaxID=1227364 RepID=A0A9W4TYF6_9ASCO|nr:unnamed protein product [Candida verbasci]
MVEFKPNQIVYAYHGPLIYEAKILKIKYALDDFIINNENQKESIKSNEPKFEITKWRTGKNGQTCFYLHYQGWNSKWDEWVGTDRILEHNEENKFKKLELDQLTKKKKKPTITTDTTNNNSHNIRSGQHVSSSSTSTSTKRQKLNSSSSSSSFVKKTINLKFSPELKYLLVNDWEYITKDKKLVKLPSKNPINQIFKDYKSFRTKKLAKNQLSILIEILSGLEIYFNRSLSLLLLYKYENLQYLNFLKNDIINQDISQSKIYGVEHLLRLIIIFPGLISQTTMDNISINVLISELEELLKFLQDRLNIYQNDYEFASPQYLAST